VRFWALSLQADSHLTEVMQEHAALLSALHAHDPAAASAAIYAHIESFARTFVARTGLLGAS
jgi:DNA-binding FadR family transcriptional regulator